MSSIVLTDEWLRKDAARAVPGAYWSSEQRAYVIDQPDPRAAAVILKLFPEVGHHHPELIELRASLLAGVRPFDNATPFYKAGGRMHAPRVRRRLDQLGLKLHEFQEVDLTYLHAVLQQHGAAYLGWERGLGKTLGTAVLMDALSAQATLVVAPNTAKRPVWERELGRFVPHIFTIVLGNTAAQRNRALQQAKGCYEADVEFCLVVHYEALAIIAGKSKTDTGRTVLGDGWKKLGIQWDLMVTDEDHRLANTKTQMCRAAKKVPASKHLLLSGSIIQHHLEELYSPHNRAFPKTYKAKWRDWNDRFLDYADSGGYGKVLIGVTPGREEAMRRELGVWMTYRRKEDELDLPPKQHIHVPIELSPGQRKAYDQLKNELLTQLDSGQIVKAHDTGIGMLTKLRQVASGLDLIGDVQDSSKLDYAVELIKDGEDDEFVVFSWYKAAVTKLAARLEADGITAFCVTGDVPHSKRAELIARFQGGEGRVFIGTLSTLGESVNLQRANKVIRLDRSYNPQLNVQAEDRVYRMGQERNVTIWDLVAKDTVDELQVLPALASKEVIRAAILGS